MTLSIVFPGQGSQIVGMGKSLAETFPSAREVFQEVDDALGQNLFRLMCEGPDTALTLTENAQPALMAVSLAALRVMESEGGFKLADRVAYVAGHSLGEYSALAAAGSLTVSDAARLLKRRGQAMQRAVPVGEGAMAALLGLDLDAAIAVARDALTAPGATASEVCAAANDNAPGQVVVSGHKAAVERAVALAAERGAKRAVMLPVSAPFHCALMAPAAEEMAAALAEVTIRPPVVPVVANVTAESVVGPETIRRLLVEQVTGTVRWRESVEYLKRQGVSRALECGTGKVLSGLIRRIDRDIATANFGEPADLEAALTFLEAK